MAPASASTSAAGAAASGGGSALPLPEPDALRAFWLSKLASWREEASSMGSKFGQVYTRAALSLKNNPLPFRHASELTQLKFFGKTITDRLEEVTKEWCKENGYQVAEKAPPSRKQAAARERREAEASQHELESQQSQHTGVSASASTSAPKKRPSLNDRLDTAAGLGGSGSSSKGKGKARDSTGTGASASATASTSAAPKKSAPPKPKKKSSGFLSDSSSDSGTSSDAARRPAKRARSGGGGAAHGGEDGSDGDDAAAGPSAKAKGKGKAKAPKPPKPPKIYIPVHRSGGYGIMLALWSVTRDAEVFGVDADGGDYDDEEDEDAFAAKKASIPAEDNEVYLDKAEIIRIAQKWSDKDYRQPDRGSSGAGGGSARAGLGGGAARGGGGDGDGAGGGSGGGAGGGGGRGGAGAWYSAWDSMKTLISHAYVYQTGSPPRFCLSEQGFGVVKGMAQVAGLRRTPRPRAQRAERAADSGTGTAPSQQARARPAARLVLPPGRAASRSVSRSVSPVRIQPAPSAAAAASARRAVEATSSRAGPSASQAATLPAAPTSTAAPSAAPAGRFAYTYLSRSNAPVQARSDAAVRLSDADYTATYAVLFAARLRAHPLVRSGAIEKCGSAERPSLTGGGGGSADDPFKGMCRGWIREEASNERAPGLGADAPGGIGGGSAAEPAAPARRAPPAAVAPASQARGAVTVVLDDSDDEADEMEDMDKTIAASTRAFAASINSSSPANFRHPKEGVVETVTIGAGYLGLKDRRRAAPSSAAPSSSPVAPRPLALARSAAARPGPSQAPVQRSKPSAIEIDDAEMEFDVADEFDEAVSSEIEEYIAAVERSSQSGPANAGAAAEESQGIQLEPRGLYKGLYGTESQHREQQQVQAARETSAAKVTKNSLNRRPRLSGVVPPPAIGISWHNAIVPNASIARNNSMPSGGAGASASNSIARTASAPTLAQEGGKTVAEEHGFQPPDFEPVIMPAGSFSIHLLIDTREVRSRGGQTARANDFAGSLQAMGVPAESRALALGDALWIARRKGGGKGEEDEVVLDFVVERKRLDDLTSSIKDGRWREQKFRLANSGLSHVVYLVEDFDVDQQWNAFGESLQTALSSTQIVDGFFVERTANVEQSLQYLASMHGIVKEMWENTDLYILPEKAVHRHTYLDLQTYLRRTHPQLTYLTSYAAYGSLNSKSGALTVRDLWARMLLCVKGLSAEKVAEVLDIWPTPTDFYEACCALEQDMRDDEDGALGPASKGPAKGLDAGQRMLYETIQAPEQRRKVGATLSAKVWDMVMKRSYAAGDA